MLIRVLLLVLLPATLVAAGTGWHKVATPRFTLYSNAAAADALQAGEELQVFISALHTIVPVNLDRLPPLTVVIFRKEKEFKPFRPLAPDGKPRDVAGYFSRAPSWAVFGLAQSSMDDELRRVVYHEAVHWFLSGDDTPNPLWLEEGLAEVFSTFAVDAKGLASWGSPLPAHIALLRHETPLPLARLLYIGRSDPLFNESLRTGVFYAGAWAFVHYLLFGEQTEAKVELRDFLAAQRGGLLPDQAFASVFKADYAQMDKTLAAYLRRGRYFEGGFPRPAELGALRAEAASEFEIAIALARLALGSDQAALAVGHARRALALTPDSPLSHELLGYAARSRKDNDGALAAFEEAARLKSRDHEVYFSLAQGIVNPGAAESFYLRAPLTPSEARRVANYLESAINCRPTHLPSFQLLGRIIPSSEPWNEQDLRFLRLGIKHYPGDPDLHLGLAAMEWKSGARNLAQNRVQALLDAQPPFDAKHRRQAQKLRDEWAAREFERELEALVDADRSAAALALIDAEIARSPESPYRRAWENRRRFIAVDVAFGKVNDALDYQQIPQARALLEALIASDAPESAKRRARDVLAELPEPAR